jgi:hypothetical protein
VVAIRGSSILYFNQYAGTNLIEKLYLNGVTHD